MFNQLVEQPILNHVEPADQVWLEMCQARTALEVAENRLDMAEDQSMIDAASHEVSAARIRLNAVFKRARSSNYG